MTNTKKDKLLQVDSYLPLMDQLFVDIYKAFTSQPMVTIKELPQRPGVYVLYESEKPIYVGRSNNIKKRLSGHTLPGSGHNSANFAFNLARDEFKEISQEHNMKRERLMASLEFVEIFSKHKNKLSNSKVKYIEIENDIIQTMFEPYLSLKLGTYPINNNFDNH